MRTNWILLAGLIGAAPIFAQPYAVSTPTAQYTSLTTLVPVTASHLDTTSAVSGGGQTLTLSSSVTVFSFGSIWTVWGAPPNTEGNPAKVLGTATNQTALTITLSSPSNTFGFEMEPVNAGGPYSLSVSFYAGAVLLGTSTQSVAYNAARLFALSSATPITSVQISAPLSAGGFGMAQFRFGNAIVGAPTPAVPTLGLPELGALSLMLAAAGALLARRQQVV
jgi:hypothetical protein